MPSDPEGREAGARARPRGSRKAAWADFVCFAVAVGLFCALGLWQLDRPGLYQDEAYDAAPAVALLTGAGGWPYTLLPGRLDLPLMVCDHVGPTSTYLMIPFLKVFGIGGRAVRLYEFACGLAALALIFLWARRVVAPGTAGVAALLAAATPSLWLACRNGLHVSFIVAPLAAGALICFDRYYEGRRRGWLYAGCFLVGVGLSTKILFVWFMAALAIGVAARKREALRRLRLREVGAGGVWFLLGAAPFVVFNALSRGLTFRTIMGAMGETPYGVRNADLVGNLRTQLDSFASLLGGSWLDWAGEAPHNPVAVWLFGAAGAYVLLRLGAPGTRRIGFCVIAVVVILVASCFTISTLHAKHLVIMLPFTPVVVAGALGMAWSERRRMASGAAFAVLAMLCAGQLGWDVWNDVRYHRSLGVTGGVGLFSQAHDELADYLVSEGVGRPLAGDWGFADNLTVLSAGRIATRQVFELRERRPFEFTRAQARETLGDPESVYLFHEEAIASAPGRLEALVEVAAEMGMGLERAATFRDGEGRAVIHVYRPARAEAGAG